MKRARRWVAGIALLSVRRSQAIAYSGARGRVTGPHLHRGLRWRGAMIDPLLAAGAMEG